MSVSNLGQQTMPLLTSMYQQILTDALKVHEHDPGFPLLVIRQAQKFLYDEEAQEDTEAYETLTRLMFIEAALIVNHSPYAEVRAVVSNKDDPSMPSSTIRAWTISMLFVAAGAVINQLFSVRQPSITVASNVAQLLSCKFSSNIA